MHHMYVSTKVGLKLLFYSNLCNYYICQEFQYAAELTSSKSSKKDLSTIVAETDPGHSSALGKSEYIILELLRLGKISKSEVDQIVAKFDMLLLSQEDSRRGEASLTFADVNRPLEPKILVDTDSHQIFSNEEEVIV